MRGRLAGSSGNAGDREDARRLLRDWWDVSDRKSLLDSLEWIEKSGHRQSFERTGQWLAALTPAQRREFDAQRRMDRWFNQKMRTERRPPGASSPSAASRLESPRRARRSRRARPIESS
jgi:hypothetical protein